MENDQKPLKYGIWIDGTHPDPVKHQKLLKQARPDRGQWGKEGANEDMAEDLKKKLSSAGW